MQFTVKLVPGAHEGEGPLELIVTLHKLADMEILVEGTENRPSE